MEKKHSLQLLNNSQFIPATSSGEPEDTLDLGRLIRGLIRNWWIVSGITLATTVAAGVKVLNRTSEYVGEFEVLVQTGSAETDVIANIPETFSSSEQLLNNAVDEDLLKILKSPKVLSSTVEAVKTRYPKFCQVPEQFIDDAAAVNNFCYEGISSQLDIRALDDSLDDNSTIVQVEFRDSDPEAVQFVLNELSQAYLDYSLEVRQADIRRGIDFVKQKLPDLQDKVDTLQDQLQNLRLQNSIMDPISRASQLAEKIGDFSQERLQIEVQLKQARAVADDLSRELTAGQEASSSALTQNPRYQALLDSLLELDVQIAEASTLYLDTLPDMEVLKDQRRNLLALLDNERVQSQREMVSQIRELETQEQALQETLRALDSDVDQLTDVARRYDDIQRELEISTENLNQFLAKQEAFEIDAAQSEIPWELVTPPTLPKPIDGDLLKFLLLGGSVGFLLGVGIALLVEESSGVIHSEEELKRFTRLPVIGLIPANENAQDMSFLKQIVASRPYSRIGAANGHSGHVNSSQANSDPLGSKTTLQSYPRDPFSESFQSLYTNLRLIGASEAIRAVAISSVMPGEGKSTVALRLAQAAAGMGQRVLLVDANLRNPQIHNYLELSDKEGLTNMFSGESSPTLIQKFSPEPNMYVIAAGSAPFEPARLFSSRSMRVFSEKVRAAFDLVIYDTPSLLGQSDAYLIADCADGMVLVTQPGKLKQALLERAMDQLQIADTNVLGVVTRGR